MARDKTKDDQYFSCSKDETDYISSLYGEKRLKIRGYLGAGCEKGGIKRNTTHMQIYEMIKKVFGYAIPD
jgi:hypothetical protein